MEDRNDEDDDPAEDGPEDEEDDEEGEESDENFFWDKSQFKVSNAHARTSASIVCLRAPETRLSTRPG